MGVLGKPFLMKWFSQGIFVIMKKIIIVLLLVFFAFSFAECGSAGPDDEFLLSRFSTLVDASNEINDIFFGKGLPTYSREDYPEAYAMTEGADPDYDFVRAESKYQSIREIKAAAEAVYTQDYLESIYALIFDGFYDEEIGHIPALYTEDMNGFAKHNATEPKITEIREYEYESAKVLMKNNAYATIEVNTSLNGQSETLRLRLKNQNGDWLLDDPTY